MNTRILIATILFRLAGRAELKQQYRKADIADKFLRKLSQVAESEETPTTELQQTVQPVQPVQPTVSPQPQKLADEENFAGTYLIPESSLSQLEAEIAKANKVIPRLQAQYGESLQPMTLTLTGERKVRPIPQTRKEEFEQVPIRYRAFVEVMLTGSTPHLNGWSFLARILHGQDDTGKNMNTFMTVPGMEIPKQYRDIGPNCEHCNQNRRRRDTFLFSHNQHGNRQVGSTCLKDFFQGKGDPHALASYLDQLDHVRKEIEKSSNEEGYGGGASYGYSPSLVSAIAAFVADKFGYTSRKRSEEYGLPPTSSIVLDILERRTSSSMDQYSKAWQDLTPEQHAYYEKAGTEAVNFGKSLKDNPDVSDFDWNLSAAAHNDIVENRGLGLFSYIPEAHRRHMQKANEYELAKQKQNELAQNGTLIDYQPGMYFIAPVTVVSNNPMETEWGITTINKLRDDNGMDLTWFASGSTTVGEPGDHAYIKGTVKQLGEYKGKPSVTITRVKVISEADAKSEQLKIDKANAKKTR